ncbi:MULTISPECIES: cell division protein FtsZ [unclassified Sphingomonas]|uniref:cell division protein FtsZ n=1 Tax=unclassified Sphingomonas TaxID=196159 RepID=UPI0006F98D8B|nr:MULTISPECIES: cell division protein FtsZ [unclassified Sphingomonas]KQX17825.1 cell division protein FtsZ [Sphingomonas sp. Root1294]KQY70751.1 cell division protein FtsZ [Sphingomonas sp. Root50]KRB91756.1 cell division protein FtsZ [Sphingomonas sp. Root720]
MTIEFMRPQVDELKPRISVIGVGGAGGNAVANMIGADVQGVDFIVANTDAQALNASSAERRIQLGLKITQGLGAGSRPEIGRAAAEETLEQVEKALEGSHMCFIAAGMGGGTGTGAAPVIAKAARDRGILTVGVVTKPFSFEGNRRMRSADAGIEELQKHVDTLIVIPNQNLFLIANPNTTFKEAFQMADQVLQQGVRGITDLMVMPGLINLDFADVRSVMSEMGKAMMGTGEATGDNRAIEAAEKAIANPLLDGVSLNGAKGVIVSITGGDDMRLLEVDEAANHIRQLVDPDANIIWGSAFNNELEGRIRVSVVATGIEVDVATMPEPSKSFSFPPRTPMRDEKSVAVPQAAPAPQAETPAPQPQAAASDTPAAPAAPAPAEEKIVLEAPEQPTAAEPLELTNLFNDELLLQPESAMPTPAAEGPSEEEAAPQGNRRWVTDAEPARRPSGAGATLFERMSNIARGAAKAQVEGDERGNDDADIPRFLNRQSNQ